MTQTQGLDLAPGWRPADTLATRVKLIRTHLGDSQRAFALRVGMTFGEVQSLEDGRAVRNELTKVKKIARATGVDREWLEDGGSLSATTDGNPPDSRPLLPSAA